MSFFEEPLPLELVKKHAPAKWAALSEGVIPLFAADPDFRVAPEIQEAITATGHDGVFSYGESYGNREFREVIADTVRTRKKIHCHPDDVMVTSGVAQAMMLVARYACRPGDEAILFDPVDFLFGRAIDESGAKRIYSQIDKEYQELDIEGLMELITPKTRLLCVCNPHNPLGRVLRRDELRALAEIAVDNNLIVMCDEIWSDIVYDRREFVSLATLNHEIAARTITLHGFSKTFGLAGLNLGYAVATNPEVMKGLKKAAPGFFYPVNSVSQAAGLTAYTKAWYWADAFLSHLQEVRDYAYARLTEIPGVICQKPEGTYVLFPDISSFGRTSEDMTLYLRKEGKVGVVPGHGQDFSYFGPSAEGNIRIVFSTTKANITEALDRIEKALNKL
jgi:aspartate/methionine/tyrosine aminotransferase